MRPGDQLGDYQLDEVIGEGAMSTVFAARKPSRERRVAIKVLKREVVSDPQYVARFLSDARANDILDHPNVVRIMDIDDRHETPFIVMELIEGASVDAIL